MAASVLASSTSSKVAALRGLLAARGLFAYIVPSADQHNGEYPPEYCLRRGFLSGFDGSAGTALVTMNEALLWTDGRYHLHAEKQLSSEWTLMKEGLPDVPTLATWAKTNLASQRVGIDATLMTIDESRNLESSCKVEFVTENLIDLIWEDQPPVPRNPFVVLSEVYSGRSWQDKVAAVRAKMTSATANTLVVSALDDVAWLLNVRGTDIEYNPVALGYVLLTLDEVRLYTMEEKVTAEVREHLASVIIRPYETFYDDLSTLPSSARVSMDPATCNRASYNAVTRSRSNNEESSPVVIEGPSPILLMKALKNDVELAGFRACHRRDAAAVINWIVWMESVVGVEPLTEVSISDRLEAFRREQNDFVMLSFATISGFGPNGAVIHYHAHAESCAAVDKSNMLVLDSGGQYKDGTTDITRTFHFGNPTQHQKDCYTRVLKGHIALSSCVFPPNIVGFQLDSLARLALWQVGLDYRHGTGHGVGHYLNVHEGPQGISFRQRKNDVPLQKGMTVTDEPGYYEEGGFGIRIENVTVVAEAPTTFNNGRFLTLEPVTLVPISTNLMTGSLLTPSEVAWIDAYHARCLAEVGPLVSGASLEWLKGATRPLADQIAL